MSSVVFDSGETPTAAPSMQPEPAGAAAAPAAAPVDLEAAELYLNRELTWLAFNRRVLHEAQDASSPVLERIKFLAITAGNLDEFFMKRIGGLKQQVAAGFRERSVDGRMPEEQIAECFSMLTERSAKLLNLKDYGLKVGNPGDVVIINAESPLQAISEVSQPLASFKHGRQTMRWNAPELLRP